MSVSKQCTVGLKCYVAKALPCSEVSNHSTQAIHGILLTKFVTINSIVILAEKSLSWSSTSHMEPFFYHYAATLAVGYTG